MKYVFVAAMIHRRYIKAPPGFIRFTRRGAKSAVVWYQSFDCVSQDELKEKIKGLHILIKNQFRSHSNMRSWVVTCWNIDEDRPCTELQDKDDNLSFTNYLFDDTQCSNSYLREIGAL